MGVLFENVAIFFCFAALLCVYADYLGKKSFFAIERPEVTYLHKNHVTSAKIWSRRYGRKDPFYYFNLEFCNAHGIGNNYTMHFYFYEFLSNMYKPSFIEVHMKVCTLMNKDKVFGSQIKKAMEDLNPNATCPLPPGKWLMPNMTIGTSILRNFPFSKGRIYFNMTYNPTQDVIASGYTDFQIKRI